MSRTSIHGGVLNAKRGRASEGEVSSSGQRLVQMNKQTNKHTQCFILYNKGNAPEMDAPVGERVSCD